MAVTQMICLTGWSVYQDGVSVLQGRVFLGHNPAVWGQAPGVWGLEKGLAMSRQWNDKQLHHTHLRVLLKHMTPMQFLWVM